MSDLKRGLAWLAGGLLLLFIVLFATGVMGNLYNATVGRQAINVQRENFERSKSYLHGKIEDLSKYKREYERATDPAEKAQIRNWILSEFANFDKRDIDNPTLYNFLTEMERGR